MEYKKLVEAYNKIEATPKRLEKTYYIATLLAEAPDNLLERLTLLLQGTVFPIWDPRVLGVASQIMIKAIELATGIPGDKVKDSWKETGDLGLTAAELVKKKKQATLFSKGLDVEKVFQNIQKIATMEGQGTVNHKVGLIAELLTSASPEEAKYITRTLLGVLRIGIGEGAMREAIAWAFLPRILGVFTTCPSCSSTVPIWEKCLSCGKHLDAKNPGKPKLGLVIKSIEDFNSKNLKEVQVIIPEPLSLGRELYNNMIDQVQDAYNITNDFGKIATALKAGSLGGLADIGLTPGGPMKVMLAIKVDSVKGGFEAVGQPCLVDYKYDGFRMQVHKFDGQVKIFTRRLEDVTLQFVGVAELVKKEVKAESFILDGEAVGFDPATGKYRPFQEISQRIKRKYKIDELAKKLPVELNIFDVVYLNGKSLLKRPYKERRELVEKIIPKQRLKIQPATAKIVANESEAELFFNEAMSSGHEGVMFKSLDAAYKPGSRVGGMVKFKPSVDTIDLVVIGAEYGEGKRAKWLSSYDLACMDGDEFPEVGKASTGLKEKPEEGLSFDEMTQLLTPIIISAKGKHVTVKPSVIVEVGFQEIQKSPTYGSGFALRFPRIVRLREDKGTDEITSLDEISEMHKKQSR